MHGPTVVITRHVRRLFVTRQMLTSAAAPASTIADVLLELHQHVLALQSNACMLCMLCAEGKKSNIVVMGEKGRAQLVRVERSKILATMNDVNKLRITFAQVSLHQVLPAMHLISKVASIASALPLEKTEEATAFLAAKPILVQHQQQQHGKACKGFPSRTMPLATSAATAIAMWLQAEWLCTSNGAMQQQVCNVHCSALYTEQQLRQVDSIAILL